MSATEVSETERPMFRPQRSPPPPPPPTQSETLSSFQILTLPTETNFTHTMTETSNELTNDVEDKCPILLFEFNQLFEKFEYPEIRSKILTRQMTTSPFTTVLWRIFLHCLPRDSSQWNLTIDASREHYNELAEKYLIDREKIRKYDEKNYDLNHPLSQEENSLWNQFYVYEELRDNIDQDVKRTCQEIAFFRQKHILDLLSRVLYIHSRDHEQTLPYRQGMHEILAVIVYLIHQESEVINEYPESNELMKKLYDPEYLAHDSYGIYQEIMGHLQLYYDFKPAIVSQRLVRFSSDKTRSASRRLSSVPFHVNETIKRVNKIYERLKYHDAQLHQKLEDLSIEPTIYGIRWLRLLFGREIPFESIPTLWTVIFCYDEHFEFVNYVFLALLKKIGQIFEKLGVYEYSCCLQYLMQPNVISDVEGIIHKALSFERTDPQRSISHFNSIYMVNASTITDIQRPITPGVNNSRNLFIDLGKNNTTNSSSNESEMAVSPGKEHRKKLDENVLMQKSCAQFIYQFIERIRQGIRKHHTLVEEEVLIQLSGLEQIAYALEGKTSIDEHSLQALLDFCCKDKTIENILSETV